jgi:hypothetical protein
MWLSLSCLYLLPILQPKINALFPQAKVTVESCDALWFPLSHRATVHYTGKAEIGRRWVQIRITDNAQNGCVTTNASMFVMSASDRLVERAVEQYRPAIEQNSFSLNDAVLVELQKTDAEWLVHCTAPEETY